MAEQHYDLFFTGQLLDGHYVDFVKADLKALFKADDAYVDALFSGQEQVIKRKIDKTTAIKFQQAFKKAGAKLVVKAHNPNRVAPASKPIATTNAQISETKSATVAAQPSTPLTLTNQKSPNESAANLVERHQPELRAPAAIPNWDISAPGAQLGEASIFQPANIDTSDLSVADVGANLIAQRGFDEPTPFIDVSTMTIAEVGSTLETLDDKPAPIVVDISHIHLE